MAKTTKVYTFDPVEVTFDHENHNFYQALGMTEEQYRSIGKRYDEMVRTTPRGSRSMFIQMVMDNFNPLEAMVVMDNVNETSKRLGGGMGSMSDLMRMLGDKDKKRDGRYFHD